MDHTLSYLIILSRTFLDFLALSIVLFGWFYDDDADGDGDGDDDDDDDDDDDNYPPARSTGFLWTMGLFFYFLFGFSRCMGTLLTLEKKGYGVIRHS